MGGLVPDLFFDRCSSPFHLRVSIHIIHHCYYLPIHLHGLPQVATLRWKLIFTPTKRFCWDVLGLRCCSLEGGEDVEECRGFPIQLL